MLEENTFNKDKIFIFILNPTAGKHKSAELKEIIHNRFVRENMQDQCIFNFTESPMHATSLAREYSEKYAEKAIIYACGGDGTINEVINGMIGSKSILSVIPTGTGNDFVKSLYSIRNVKDIVENIFEYRTKWIDCASLSGRVFINVSSLGFDTFVAERAKRIVGKFNFLGPLSYFIAIFLCLFGKNYFKIDYTIETIDGDGLQKRIEKKNVEFVLAAIGNGKGYGGMFLPCPDAKLDDGYLDFCIVDRLSVLKILTMIPKYIRGGHTGNSEVHMYKVKSGVIKGAGEKLLVNCDGETFEKETVDFEIIPNAVEVAYY